MPTMIPGVERREQPAQNQTAESLCLIPPELEAKLLEPLRRHFEGTETEVLVERRSRERRSQSDRRTRDAGPPRGTEERRRIRNVPDRGGRRVGERRAELVPAAPPADLPRKARGHAAELVFCQRVALDPEALADQDTARLVTRIQANGKEEFAALYERYFDRVYAYLRVALKDSHEAEDATQQLFVQALEALPRYERRNQPFRAWLFVIARNLATQALRKRGRLELETTDGINRWRERAEAPRGEPGEPPADTGAITWISDPDLLVLIDRLPAAQRQALALRHMLGFSNPEIAQILGRTEVSVRVLQSRALAFLRERLLAIGRGPAAERRAKLIRWPRQARVLRARRFSLLGAGPVR